MYLEPQSLMLQERKIVQQCTLKRQEKAAVRIHNSMHITTRLPAEFQTSTGIKTDAATHPLTTH